MAHYPRLKELRISHSLTQKEVAKLLSVSPQQYSRYENGLSGMKAPCLIILAKTYNVSAGYILNLTDDPTPI